MNIIDSELKKSMKEIFDDQFISAIRIKKDKIIILTEENEMEEELYIYDYRLYQKQEKTYGWGLNDHVIIQHPFVRIYVSKDKYNEILNEKKEKDCLRTVEDTYFENLVKKFVEDKGKQCEIIGYDKTRDFRGDNLDENGYFITAELLVKDYE